MYAYKQATWEEEKRLRLVKPSPKHALQYAKNRQNVRKKTKKINPIVYAFRLTILLLTFTGFTSLIFPLVFNNIVHQVFNPDRISGINIQGSENINLAKLKPEYIDTPDLYSIANPIVSYINNDLFLNRLMLTPTVKKTHSEVTTMYQTAEISGLKNQLQNLMKEYPDLVIVLKGENTIVASKGTITFNTTGNNAMAKGGSGDVLCGVCGSFLAQRGDYDSIVAAVYLHSWAGDRWVKRHSHYSLLASDLINEMDSILFENLKEENNAAGS